MLKRKVRNINSEMKNENIIKVLENEQLQKVIMFNKIYNYGL